MAGDWIKMRADLSDDPAVIGISTLLKVNEYEVIGRLHSLWSWADKHTADGFIPHISERWIDKFVEKSGFAAAMRSVSWLVVESNGVTFPHFDRHNGDSAKARAAKTQIQAKWRSKKGANVDQSQSTKTSTRDLPENQISSTKTSTREEKRREESKPPYPATSEAVTTESCPTDAVDADTGEVIPWAA